jgi:hypothetical protein
MSGRRHASPRRTFSRPRPLSWLLAAPALVTVAVIAVSLVIAAGHTGDKSGSTRPPAGTRSTTPAAPGTATPAALKDGWYTVKAVTAAPSEYCLAAIRDNQNRPTLAQLRCDEHDRTQRVRLESTSADTYNVEIRLGPSDLACATLDSEAAGARLHLNGCDTGARLQKFSLVTTAPGVVQVRPVATGMCLGVDNTSPATLYAMQTGCGTAVRGYGFTPAAAPTGS